MFGIQFLKSLLPTSFLQKQYEIKRRIYFILRSKIIIPLRAKKVRRKKIIRVLFIAYTPGMWKVDSLYRAMRNHERFSVEILLSPNMTLTNIDARKEEAQILKKFFKKKEYHYVEWCDIHGNCTYKKIPDEYDIILYPQPWEGIIPHPLDFMQNKNKLMINCEYAFHSTMQSWGYNKWYQNAAWIDCFENDITKKLSCLVKFNGGLNSIITGLPIVDEFRRSKYFFPWKPQNSECKKIIWAPHWTITEHCSALPQYSNFLEIADKMLNLAKENIGKLQFAFKPHPNLKRELYKHPDWGQERCDSYYSAWQNAENTQLADGDYVDLFMTSDAMIHDCCSFCCEYMLTNKPILFLVKNEERQVSQLNQMAKEAFYNQYIGHFYEDITHFIQDRVINGRDSLKKKRSLFVDKYLTPNNHKTSAENIINAILGTTEQC